MTGSRYTVVVLTSSVVPGKCSRCRAQVLWATRASEPGKPAKSLSFNLPRPMPLSTHENSSGLKFEVWPSNAMHVISCPASRQPKRQTTADAPSAAPARKRERPLPLLQAMEHTS